MHRRSAGDFYGAQTAWLSAAAIPPTPSRTAESGIHLPRIHLTGSFREPLALPVPLVLLGTPGHRRYVCVDVLPRLGNEPEKSLL